MSWARIDDSFTEHPKVLALTDREFRVHMRAICYAARFRTNGVIPTSSLPAMGATEKVKRRLLQLGLWENGGSELLIHDFEDYNPRDPTGALRKRRERQKKEPNDEPPLA